MYKYNPQNKGSSIRKALGSVIAEAPGVIWVLFICLAFPAMCYASLFYRASLVYYATRDSCYKAAKSPTFSTASAPNDAQDNAAAAFKTDMAAFTGVSGTETIYIVTQPLAGGSSTTSTSKLGTINTTNNVYFIRAVTNATIQPLFTIGPTWLGMSIPGLTGPYQLLVVAQVYAENPTGLLN